MGNPGGHDGAEWMRTSHGVLKEMVPRWLNETDFAGLSSGWAPAHRRHGGDGAFYVYLRKKNEAGFPHHSGFDAWSGPLLNQPGIRCQLLQRCFRPRAIMRDHFRRRQRAQPAAIGQALAVGQAIQKSGGELIARAGGVHHLGHRRGRHGVMLAAFDRRHSPWPSG